MSKNEITGDALISRSATDAYRSGWDRIFKKAVVTSEDSDTSNQEVVYNDSSTTEDDECLKTSDKACSP